MQGKKGFTLIELVVVIAILGILAGIAIPRLMDATAAARGAKIVADLRTIDSAATLYNSKTGFWPNKINDLLSDDIKKNQYKLLVARPEPPQGLATLVNNVGKTIELPPVVNPDTGKVQVYSLDNKGRATFAKLTLEELMNLP
ncbi:MAG: prepilin-type N-terminal cleavage/methylation domain-containing protein [Acidaminococcaceae bacterium]